MLVLISIDYWVAMYVSFLLEEDCTLTVMLTRELNRKHQQRPTELSLDAVGVVFTFWIAYLTPVALAKVQERRTPGG
jgi:hypothetical protein